MRWARRVLYLVVVAALVSCKAQGSATPWPMPTWQSPTPNPAKQPRASVPIVPSYPNAEEITATTVRGNIETKTITMFVSADSTDSILGFYQRVLEAKQGSFQAPIGASIGFRWSPSCPSWAVWIAVDPSQNGRSIVKIDFRESACF